MYRRRFENQELNSSTCQSFFPPTHLITTISNHFFNIFSKSSQTSNSRLNISHHNLCRRSLQLSSHSFYASPDRSIVSRGTISNHSQSLASLLGQQILRPLCPMREEEEEEAIDYRGAGDGAYNGTGRPGRRRKMTTWKVLAGIALTGIAAKLATEFFKS